MSWFSLLFGSSKKPKKRKKATKKAAPKRSVAGLKHFVVFDKYSNAKVAEISGKTEGGAWKAFGKAGYAGVSEPDDLRVMSKKRWESEQ